MRTVFLVGAGGSFPEPAGLPLFSDFLRGAKEAIPRRLATRFDWVAPESLMWSLVQAGVDAEGVLLDIFNSQAASPNAIHFTLAHRLLAGDSVWTTNYDTLIEDAVELLAHDKGDAAAALCRLTKPHGTFVRSGASWSSSHGLVFNAQQVLVEWDDAWRLKLVADCLDARLVIIGYSGADVNSYASLLEAMSEASDVHWYEFGDPAGTIPDLVRQALQRFPRVSLGDFDISWSPGARFTADQGTGLSFSYDPRLASADPACPPPLLQIDMSALTAAVREPMVLARLAALMGESRSHANLARQIRRDATSDLAGWVGARLRRKTPCTASPRRPMVELAFACRSRIRGLRGARPIRSIRSRVHRLVCNAPPRMWAPTSVRSRALSNRPFDSVDTAQEMADRCAVWLERASKPEHAVELLLHQSRALRFVGRHADATKKAQLAISLARHPDNRFATLAAHGEVELIEGLRSMGRFDEALEATRLRLHTLGMSHWGAWFDYEQACLHLQLRQFDVASAHIERARRFWSSVEPGDTAYDPSLGHPFALLAEAALLRCAGNLAEAERALDAAEASDGQRRGPALLESTVAFQRAEIARARCNWEGARSCYEAMDLAMEIYGGLSLLGRALCAVGEGADHEVTLTWAIQAFASQECAFGLAYCLRLPSATNLRKHIAAPLLTHTDRASELMWPAGPPNLDADQQIAWL